MNSVEPAPAVVEEAQGEEMEEVDVTKAVTEEDGESSAEERFDNVTPVTDQSLQELGKSVSQLTKLIAGKQTQSVQKAKPAQVNKNQAGAMNDIAKMLAGLVQKMDAQEKFNTEIMNAIGFTDDVVKKSLPDNPVPQDKPIQSLDSKVFLKEVLTEAFKAIPAMANNQNRDADHPFNKKKDVRKNLRSLVDYIGQGKRG